MQNDRIKSKKRKLVNIILIIGGLIVLSPIGFLVWHNISPKPMGNRLEYIGKQDFGCIIIFCDSDPVSTYFYSTDMQIDEFKNYFKQTTHRKLNKSHSNLQRHIGGVSYWELTVTDKSNKTFFLAYYEDGKLIASDNGFTSLKKHLVTLSSRYYDQAKDSL